MYGTVRYILFDKNVIDTKIENCSIPPFKQGVKFALVSTGYVIYRVVKVGNETKSVILKQRTAEIKTKNPKKKNMIKSQNLKKIFSIISCVCCERQINLLFLLSIFFCKLFFLSVLLHLFS
jgi:hypothetical protein